jgi:hypothetical protein
MCKTMSKAVCSTIELNSQGVAHLHRGHFHFAVRSLSDALLRSKQILSEEDSVGTCCFFQEGPEEKRGHTLQPMSCQATVAIQIDIPSFSDGGAGFLKKENRALLTNTSNTQNFIFRKAFIINGNGFVNSTNIRYAIICLFNLALSHHLWALEIRLSGCPEVAGPRLLTGIRLYELAYNLLMQAEDLQMDPVFALAIVNNLWQIHNTSEDHVSAELCLEHLLSSLMFFCDRDDIRPQFIDYMDGFFSNAMRLILKDSVTAPAA